VQKEKRKHQRYLNNTNIYLDSMNKIKEIPLSVALQLINKMVKINKAHITIPYINPHTNIQEKLQLSISINTISK